MNHDNITEQIGALAEDLQMTKEALMGKLEVHLDPPPGPITAIFLQINLYISILPGKFRNSAGG